MKSLSELWDTFKQSNICTMGVIEMEGERTEKIFLKILDKVFQNLMTTTPTSPKSPINVKQKKCEENHTE